MSSSNMDKYPVVHIYAQHSQHMEAVILGNRQGLCKLFFAIGAALSAENKKENGEVEVYVNDGEGYDIAVQVVENVKIDTLPVPYVADYAQDKTGVNPASFIK